MWVKLCGMTKLEDALYAQELGASAIGFIFAKSPRAIAPEKAAAIARALEIPTVGVFVNSPIAEIQEIRSYCHLDMVQLHGNEDPDFCRELGGTIIKAFRVKSGDIHQQMRAFSGVWKFLVDAYDPHQHGGTGKRIEHRHLATIDDFSDIILAGGLNPKNIADAITSYQPFGVDISSGIEESPGVKDHGKMEQLMREIRSIENGLSG